MAFLLSFILVIVAIFVGKGKGVALWLVGSLAIVIMFNEFALYQEVQQAHQMWIVALFGIITAISIMISRWWGLLFYFVASIAGTVVVFFAILATTQIH